MARISIINCSIWALGFLIFTSLLGQQVNAISCQEAITKMMPCLAFLKGYGNITVPCMKGAQALNKMATTNPTRRVICECFKKVAKGYKVDVDRAKQLPQLSRTTLPFEVNPNVNCDKFNVDGSKLNRLKKFETKAFRPTTPGHSPGAGHGSPPARGGVRPIVVKH